MSEPSEDWKWREGGYQVSPAVPEQGPLNVAAEQLGFATDDEAIEALQLGARLKAHGFTNKDLDGMIEYQYTVRALEEVFVGTGYATPSETRRVIERSRR